MLCSFSRLLEDLEASKQELGIRGYGLAETTLEEVFLAVNSKGKGVSAADVIETEQQQTALLIDEEDTQGAPLLPGQENGFPRVSGSFDGDLRRPSKLIVTILCLKLNCVFCAQLCTCSWTEMLRATSFIRLHAFQKRDRSSILI